MSIETMDHNDLVRHLERSAFAAGVSHIEWKNAHRDGAGDALVAMLRKAAELRQDHSLDVMKKLLAYDEPIEVDTSPMDEANRVIQEAKTLQVRTTQNG